MVAQTGTQPATISTTLREGDFHALVPKAIDLNFNPLPPRGGDQRWFAKSLSITDFNHSSARGDTAQLPFRRAD